MVAPPKAQHVVGAPEATKHVDVKAAIKAAPAKPAEAKAAMQAPGNRHRSPHRRARETRRGQGHHARPHRRARETLRGQGGCAGPESRARETGRGQGGCAGPQSRARETRRGQGRRPDPKAAPAKPAEAKAAVQTPKAAPAKPAEAKAAVKSAVKATHDALPKPAAVTPEATDIQKEAENKVAAMPRKALPQAVSTKTSPFASVEDQVRAAFAAKVC